MDKELINALEKETERQQNNIELIASENYASKYVRSLQGSILTNKYAEGYPSHRYYGGCQYIDIFEEKAKEYACKLFECNYANVQPHSGSSANMAVYRALLQKGDTVMGMNLSHGGHLTHGHSLSFSGQDYNIVPYNVNLETEVLDYEEIEKLAMEVKPKMIIAGYSAYPRIIDFKKFRDICDKCGAYLMVDMAHIAGLIAAKLHPSPFPYADVVTTTTHKTLRGPRGGMILTNDEELAKKIDKTIFPGIQGGPLMHVVGAKAECFYEALQPEFRTYQEQVIKNCKAMCDEFIKLGCKVVSNGTDNHLMLLNVKDSFGVTGKLAENILDTIHITVNKNTIPNDTEKPFVTSGIRLGSAAMTTRGFKEEEFIKLANIIYKALSNVENEEVLKELDNEVLELTKKFPIDNI